MKELMQALMKHKKRGNMDEKEMHSKLGVLKDIHDMASNDLGHDIHGLKKVSVMSDSDAGMQEGLKKAGALVKEHGSTMADEDADRVSDDMHSESKRHQLAHHSEMSDEEDGMADAHGDLHRQGAKAMEGYAQGGMIHPGQYGEDEADVVGTPHQSRQDHGMNTQYAQPTINKEKGPAKNYAKGGMVDPDAEVGGEVAEHQHDQKHKIMQHSAETIAKEKDNKMVSGKQHSVADAMQKGTHGPHGSPDPADEYADLEPDELEALIAHLQRHRKSSSSF